MKSIGTQIAIDMYNCSDILLDDVIGIEHMLSSAAARFGMEPSGVYVTTRTALTNIPCSRTASRDILPCTFIRIWALPRLIFLLALKKPTPMGWHTLCANTSIPTNPKSLIWNAAISVTKAI